MILREAIFKLLKELDAKEIYYQHKGRYIDHRNKNYNNKVVGHRLMVKNSKGETRWFFVTFRPKGVTGYTKDNIPMTLMNSSEINFQLKYGWERLILFKKEDDTLAPLIFPIVGIRAWLTDNELNYKDDFHTDAPDEDERGYNLPIFLSVDFRNWLDGTEEIP